MIETIKALKVILIRIITKSMGFHYTIAASSPFRFALFTTLFFARCNRQSTRPLHCCLRWRETHRLDKHCSCTLFAHILARVSPRWLFDASATRRLRDGWMGWNQCAREILTSVPRRKGRGGYRTLRGYSTTASSCRFIAGLLHLSVTGIFIEGRDHLHFLSECHARAATMRYREKDSREESLVNRVCSLANEAVAQ